MILPKRLSLQLTPLLDLLLIVIFAQYLEVQETQVTIEDNAAVAQVERDRALAELQQVQQQLEISAENERVIADLLDELFNVPQDEIEKALNNQFSPGRRTAEDVERLKERFRQLAVEQSGRVVEHLLSYEEIRKRCDVWDVHITPENFLRLTSGEKTLEMQVPLDIATDFAQQEFIDQFIELAHTLPEPKSLVIMMFTRDKKSAFWSTWGVRDTLPQIVLRMNLESAGRTRYDYADLGFRIE